MVFMWPRQWCHLIFITCQGVSGVQVLTSFLFWNLRLLLSKPSWAATCLVDLLYIKWYFLFIIITITSIIILRKWVGNGRVIIACSKISFGGDSYRREISEFICILNQLTGFYVTRVSAEWNHRIYFNWYSS